MGTRIRYDTFFSNRPNPPGFLAMRHFLISALLLSLLAGCAGTKFGPHRIDVQQGNALDQENVARLKTGLSRSQVRFLLGTPLLDDPFHNDRWDYVYVFYRAGNLAEQRRISLFFDGDTLVRIEGDMPAAEPVAQGPAPTPSARPGPQAETQAEPVAADAGRAPAPAAATQETAVKATAAEAPTPAPVAAQAAAKPVPAKPAAAAIKTAPTAAPTAAPAASPAPEPVATPTAATKPASPKRPPMSAATSIVQPLPTPKGAPPYKDPHPVAQLSLQPETDVAHIKPDVMPAFPEPAAVETAKVGVVNEEAVLKALNAWVDAWSRRDDAAYFAAYDPSFIPQGGGSHADWERRKRMLFEVARNIEVRIESPSVDLAADGNVTVTFNQFYRSDNYRDAVVKQLRMTERDGRWLIVDEKVLSVLHGARQ
jgi:outer membrane protein assembly factor BamE